MADTSARDSSVRSTASAERSPPPPAQPSPFFSNESKEAPAFTVTFVAFAGSKERTALSMRSSARIVRTVETGITNAGPPSRLALAGPSPPAIRSRQVFSSFFPPTSVFSKISIRIAGSLRPNEASAAGSFDSSERIRSARKGPRASRIAFTAVSSARARIGLVICQRPSPVFESSKRFPSRWIVIVATRNASVLSTSRSRKAIGSAVRKGSSASAFARRISGPSSRRKARKPAASRDPTRSLVSSREAPERTSRRTFFAPSPAASAFAGSNASNVSARAACRARSRSPTAT